MLLPTLALARSLNLTVMAEGVETQEQVDWLLQRGCRYLQGYRFSRPVPQAEFLLLAARHYALHGASSPDQALALSGRA